MQRKFVLRGKLFVPHWWDKEGFTCLNMSVCNLVFEVLSLLLLARRRAPHAPAPPPASSCSWHVRGVVGLPFWAKS